MLKIIYTSLFVATTATFFTTCFPYFNSYKRENYLRQWKTSALKATIVLFTSANAYFNSPRAGSFDLKIWHLNQSKQKSFSKRDESTSNVSKSRILRFEITNIPVIFSCLETERETRIQLWAPRHIRYWDTLTNPADKEFQVLLAKSSCRVVLIMSNEVIAKSMKRSASSILVFHVFISFAIGNVFEINRYRNFEWWKSRDIFKLPISICNRTRTGDVCGSFDAVDDNQICTCSCPLSRATFAFDDDKWRCVENGEVRQNLQGKKVMVF